jgi:hypothetical protein
LPGMSQMMVAMPSASTSTLKLRSAMASTP